MNLLLTFKLVFHSEKSCKSENLTTVIWCCRIPELIPPISSKSIAIMLHMVPDDCATLWNTRLQLKVFNHSVENILQFCKALILQIRWDSSAHEEFHIVHQSQCLASISVF